MTTDETLNKMIELIAAQLSKRCLADLAEDEFWTEEMKLDKSAILAAMRKYGLYLKVDFEPCRAVDENGKSYQFATINGDAPGLLGGKPEGMSAEVFIDPECFLGTCDCRGGGTLNQ